MENKKIGLCIQETYKGEKHIYESEPEADWIRGVVDVRDIFQKISVQDGEIFYLIKYSKIGVYLVLGKMLSAGREGDNVAAWLFFPKEILLSVKDDIPNIVGSLREKLLLDEYKETSLYEKIVKDKFKPYSIGDKVEMHPAVDDQDRPYAVVYYENSQLEKLLQPVFLLQQERLKYRGVILLPSNPKRECGLKIIEKEHLVSSCVVKLEKKFPKNVSVKILNNPNEADQLLPETSYIRLQKERLQLLFEKVGYAPISLDYEVVGDNGVDIIGLNTLKLNWMISVSRDMFFVTDEQGTPVEEYSLKIQGKECSDKTEVSETDAQNLPVKIFSDGFVVYDRFLNVLGQRVVHVPLEYVKEDHVYLLPCLNGTEEPLTINERIDQCESPVKGYKVEMEDSTSHKGQKISSKQLVPFVDYKEPKIYRPIVLSSLIGMLIGCMITLFIFISKNKKEVGKSTPDQEWCSAENTDKGDTLMLKDSTISTGSTVARDSIDSTSVK